jgi:ribulose-bisphosphate carboxylase large chain
MFSETFAGGTVRMVREATRDRPNPPAIYGHNAGIGVKTRAIWREVIDLLARLDGIDFRQTAPVKPGTPFLKPYGAEWEASEEVLSRPLPGIRPTMIARAGGLDQGNIGLNLADVERRGLGDGVLFLAGSAINSIKNARGEYDPKPGAEAMQQALDVHRSGELREVPAERHAAALLGVAERKGLKALREALRQRYPGLAAS